MAKVIKETVKEDEVNKGDKRGGGGGGEDEEEEERRQ